MKFKSLFTILNIALCLFSSQINAYIFKGYEFDNGEQKVIGLGDIHFGCNRELPHPELSNKELKNINIDQAKNIVQSIDNIEKDLKKDRVCLLVEDMLDVQTINDKKLKNYFTFVNKEHNKNCFTNSLQFTHSLCKKNKISVVNFEFRQSAEAFLNSIITGSEFLKDFNSIIEEISNYNDNGVLNQFYKKTLKKFLKDNAKCISLLKQHENEYRFNIKKITKNMLADFIYDYGDLIDARILHNIYINKDKKYIYICAGNDHINNIQKILEKIGYKKTDYIENYDNQIEAPLDLKNFLKNNKQEIITVTSKQPVTYTGFILILALLITGVGLIGLMKFIRRFNFLNISHKKI